eukprot:TRINITY_DN67188_c9_g1_i5.p1 TRINITY_DN67188_c9_g1~~TRINITY_DN67188_c9_g1_i5.p1  ORF type:complete len:205 (+),score=19.83 TRINITY_DN67188_c9_g1_i5:39-653(+)
MLRPRALALLRRSGARFFTGKTPKFTVPAWKQLDLIQQLIVVQCGVSIASWMVFPRMYAYSGNILGIVTAPFAYTNIFTLALNCVILYLSRGFFFATFARKEFLTCYLAGSWLAAAVVPYLSRPGTLYYGNGGGFGALLGRMYMKNPFQPIPFFGFPMPVATLFYIAMGLSVLSHLVSQGASGMGGLPVGVAATYAASAGGLLQ